VKRHAPATSRNRDAILAVFRDLFAGETRVLELASGTGEHAVWFSQNLPHVTWQPSDVDPEAVISIDAYREEARLPNLRAPIQLDSMSEDWGAQNPDAIVCINMIHIAPWTACEGLLRGAGRLLAPGGVLYLYGPYRFGGRYTAPSNEAFDASLRQRNPAWGVRDLDQITQLAASNGLAREAVIPMPANNHSVVFRHE
jgi:SAM-dependent methyltransferase